MENKIHYFILKEKQIRYLCNQATSISKKKITNDYFKVTCKNCKDILERDILKVPVKKRTEGEQLRQILHDLDWFKIMQKAVDSRKTSWNFEGYGHPIIEWRNATDEVCMAVINALEDKGILEDMYSKVEKIRRKAEVKQKGGLNEFR